MREKSVFTLILSMVILVNNLFARSSEDFKCTFYNALTTDVEEARDILNEWTANDSTDVELLKARCMLMLVADPEHPQNPLSLIKETIAEHPDELRYRLDYLDLVSILGSIDSVCEAYRVVGGADNTRCWISASGEIVPQDSVEKALNSKLVELFYNISQMSDVETAEKFADFVHSVEKDELRRGLVDYSLASVYLENDRYDEAMDKYSSLLGRDCGIVEGSVYYNMAQTSLKSGNREKALEYARKAAESEEEYTKKQADELIKKLSEPVLDVPYATFQFHLLPAFSRYIAPGSKSEKILINPDLFVKKMGEYNYRIDRDLSAVSAVIVNVDTTDVIVWRMLKPEDMTDCLYIGFVPDGNHYRMVALEKTLDFDDKSEGKFLLCEVIIDENNHPARITDNTLIDGSCTPTDFASIAFDFVHDDTTETRPD